jgi:hypothetical protein
MSSKSDQLRFRLLQDLGCICCLVEGLGHVAPDIHHIVDNGYRRLSGGHKSTIPLCPFHHRAVPPNGMTAAEAEACMGPSMKLNKKKFIEKYGTERSLLTSVDLLIRSRMQAA